MKISIDTRDSKANSRAKLPQNTQDTFVHPNSPGGLSRGPGSKKVVKVTQDSHQKLEVVGYKSEITEKRDKSGRRWKQVKPAVFDMNSSQGTAQHEVDYFGKSIGSSK